MRRAAGETAPLNQQSVAEARSSLGGGRYSVLLQAQSGRKRVAGKPGVKKAQVGGRWVRGRACRAAQDANFLIFCSTSEHRLGVAEAL